MHTYEQAERWLSGRRRTTRNRLIANYYSWVRIPPSPVLKFLLIKLMKQLFYLVGTISLLIAINPRIGSNETLGGSYAVSCNFSSGIFISKDGVQFMPGMKDGGLFAPLFDVRRLVGCL